LWLLVAGQDRVLLPALVRAAVASDRAGEVVGGALPLTVRVPVGDACRAAAGDASRRLA